MNAVGFNANSTDELRRTASLPNDQNFAVSMWVRFDTVDSTFHTAWALTTASRFFIIGLNSSNHIIFQEASNTVDSGITAVAGRWYWIGASQSVLVVSGEMRLHVASVLDADITTASLGGITYVDFTPARMSLGRNQIAGNTEALGGAVANVMVWSGLTPIFEAVDPMLHQHRFATRPLLFLESLNLWSPLFEQSDTAFLDMSGNARHWAEFGTVVGEAGPPIGRHHARVISSGAAAPTPSVTSDVSITLLYRLLNANDP